MRNAYGVHFTELSFELLDDDAIRFGQLVLQLADAIVDPNAGWPVDERSGELLGYWRRNPAASPCCDAPKLNYGQNQPYRK